MYAYDQQDSSIKHKLTRYDASSKGDTDQYHVERHILDFITNLIIFFFPDITISLILQIWMALWWNKSFYKVCIEGITFVHFIYAISIWYNIEDRLTTGLHQFHFNVVILMEYMKWSFYLEEVWKLFICIYSLYFYLLLLLFLLFLKARDIHINM